MSLLNKNALTLKITLEFIVTMVKRHARLCKKNHDFQQQVLV